jgi:hypothetical protein
MKFFKINERKFMTTDNQKAKIVAALQPLYADPDFANLVGDLTVTVVTPATVVTPPPDDTEQVDVPKV